MIHRALTRLRVSRPVGLLRYHAYRTLLSRPRRVACNLCAWRGRRFLTYRHRHVLCPACGSQVRHRLIEALVSSRPDLTHGVALAGRRVLHLSPEYCLTRWIRPAVRSYVTADYAASADVRTDATRLPFPNETFDVFVACDVLEHIAEDRRALADIRRVLRPSAIAILTVPQADGLATSIDDPAIATSADRTAAFGQPDHVRLYGDDFAERVANAGFEVSVVRAEALPSDTIVRHVLRPPVPLVAPWADNDRPIVFARRREVTQTAARDAHIPARRPSTRRSASG